MTGRLVRLAVERHVQDLQRAGKRGFYFDARFPIEAIEFMETCCRHSKGQQFADKPLRLTPCQKFIVWCVFGWRRESDGLRRFKKAYLSMARKWGKSTFAAALALLLLVFDNPLEPGAEVYAVATKEDQAKIVHDEAKRMVKKSPALRRRLQVHTRSIDYADLDSCFKRIGSDGEGADGQNLHGAIMDELHAWREHHRSLHEKLTTAGGARLQPLWVTITTAGDDKSAIWEEEQQYAARAVEAVITGTIIDDTLFAFICQIDDDDDPFDETVWIKANPHLGETVRIEDLRDQANEAQGKPTSLNKFLRYVCNIQTRSSERAIMPELWAAGGGGGDPADVAGRVGFGGWDLGRSNDWAAAGVVFPCQEWREIDGEEKQVTAYDVRVQCWTCEDSPLELDQAPFREFVDAGELIVCSGDAVDYDAVEDWIVQTSAQHEVRSWAYDRTFSEQVAQHVLNQHGLEVFPFSQSARFYNEPIRTLLRLLKDGLLRHGDNACLGWQAGNLTIRRNHRDEWLPEKKGGGFKIDGMVAVLMALSEALYHGAEGSSESAIVEL